MRTKTISLKKEAYDRLRVARCFPAESFSEVVLRATWPEDTIAARGLLRVRRFTCTSRSTRRLTP
jgi:hypothetical protein